MNTFEAIDARCSYRGPFTDKPVPRADLRSIVQAGIQAPSGCNAQTTSFVIVDSPERIRAIAEITEKPALADAKAIIVTVMETREVYRDMSFGVEDYACAVENMLLAIAELGYATVWIDGALRMQNRAGKIAELLGVPRRLSVRVILPVGIAAEPCEQKEKLPFEQRAWFNRYGG